MMRAADLDGAPPLGEGGAAVVGGRGSTGTGGPAHEARPCYRDGVITEIADGNVAPDG